MQRKRNIYLIIIIVGVALTGLLTVQTTWAFHTYRLTQKEFTSNAMEAIRKTVADVNSQLVCIEVFSKIHLNADDGLYILRHKVKDKKFVDPQLAPPDSTPLFIDEPRYKMSFQKQHIMFKYPGDLSLLLQFEYMMSEHDTVDLFGNSTVKNYREVFNKGVSIEKRYLPRVLDSLLKMNLEKTGITEHFRFSYIDNEKNKTVFNSDKKYGGTSVTAFRTQLTNSRYFSKPFDLAVEFDDYTGAILSRTGRLLITSLIIVIILLTGFIVFISIILKQKKLSDLKNDFINNMTHEFKTPLTNISLAMENIAEKNFLNSAKDEQIFRIIGQETERLRDNVDRILQITRFEKEKMELKLELINAHQLILKVAGSFELLTPADELSIKCDLQATKKMLYLDEVHFFNALYNLVDNAIKYNLNQPEIKIITRDSAKGMIIQVKDNGIGMSPADTKKVFDKFYRVQAGNVHDVKGYGLGLSYVKLIINAHHGSVKLHSWPDRGSEFEIFIPYTNEG